MSDTATDKPTTRQSPNYTRVAPPRNAPEPVEEVAYAEEPEPKKPDDTKPEDDERVNWGMVVPIAVCTLAVIAAGVALAIQWLGPWLGLAVSVGLAAVAFLAWWCWGRFRKKGRERRKARRRERRAARDGTGLGLGGNPLGGSGPKPKGSGKGTGNRKGKSTGSGGTKPKGSGKSSKGDRLASLLPGTRQNRNKKNGLPLSPGKKPKGTGKGKSKGGAKPKGAGRTPGLPKGTKPKGGGVPKSKRGKFGFGSGGFPKSLKFGKSDIPNARNGWKNTKTAAKTVGHAAATGRAGKAAVDVIKPTNTPKLNTPFASRKGSTMSKKESNMLALSRQMIDGAKKEHKHDLEVLFYQLVEEIDGTFANLAEVMKITGEQAVDRNSVLVDLKPFAEGITALYKHLNEGRPLAQALDAAVKKSRRYQEFRTRMDDVNGASRDVAANRKAV